MPSLRRRSGITLLEVLVAIFIMGIGLLAILVLFPLGALTMARAIQDDRCAQAAQQASNLALALQLRSDAAIISLPCYVDPFGSTHFSGTQATFLLPTTIPVVTPVPIPSTPSIARIVPTNLSWNLPSLSKFTLLDDLTFDPNGLPSVVGGNINRADRYTWAYFIQSGGTSTTTTPPYDLCVVVYAARTTQSSEYSVQLSTLSATVPVNASSLTIGYPSNAETYPHRGSWILDAGPAPIAYGYYYRIVDVTDNGVGLQLDLERPLRASISSSNNMLIQEDVVEVFERGGTQ